MAEAREYPLSLQTVRGPFPRDLVERAARSLGPGSHSSVELVQKGLIPPNVLAGLSLFLLVGQPRRRRRGGGPSGAVAGGVWVRERSTVHRPVRIDEPLEVRGETARRYSRAGRLYTVTTSQAFDEAGQLLASSCTTGLVRYRPDPDLADGAEGRAEDEVVIPGADASRAGANPSAAALARLRAGDAIAAPKAVVTLELMRERDGGRAENPIHTDPEAARDAGLAAPIAGGSHVLAFAQEAIMDALGPEVLLHGAHFDVRWVGPVHAGTEISPRVAVSAVRRDEVEFDIEVPGKGRAMVGRAVVPLASRS